MHATSPDPTGSRRALAVRAPLAALAALAALLSACRDEDGPFGALEALWPDADGTTWTYDYAAERMPSADFTWYPSPADVPPPPTLAEVEAQLASHGAGAPAEQLSGTWTLGFDGIRITESGARGRRVVTSLAAGALARDAGGDPPPAGHAFLARLWRARPDLRARLEAAGWEGPDPAVREIAPFQPMFLDGYAWMRTADWIGGYGDLDRRLSWKYLEADPRPGSEFTLQLVPALTDDVFLHARILARSPVDTPAGRFDDVVTCLYLVDFGLGSATDATGGTIGWAQVLSYGVVSYAAGVGPVAAMERPFVGTGDPLPPAEGEIRLALRERPVVPSRP